MFPAEYSQGSVPQQALDLLEKTEEHLFVTGKAGTGKTTLLRYLKEKSKKNIVIVAPTGVSAIHIKGQTIHSFFRFPPKFIRKENLHRLNNSPLMRKMDTLMIDEVSMLRADLLDGIDYSLRLNRDEMKKPFGGVQVFFFGDLYQLPPVVDREMKEVFDLDYQSPYFFSARVFQELKLKKLELTEVHRQKDDEFLSLLEKIRTKTMTKMDLSQINRLTENEFDEESSVILTTTNQRAGAINKTRLARLTGQEFVYKASVSGQFEDGSFPTDDHLSLKKGAQIMLIRNDDQKRWVNGTLAKIHDLDQDFIRVEINGCVHDVTPFIWEKISYTYNDVEDKIDEKVMGRFEQYPIKLAWAVTIHKSQGQTFDKIVVDFDAGAFSHGQVYVALSRCTSMAGITLRRPLLHSDVILDERIHRFKEDCLSIG